VGQLLLVISDAIPELKNLSPREKLQLASELLEEVTGHGPADEIAVNSETQTLLAQSLEEYRRDPNQGVRWEILRDRLKTRSAG
jgi:putative addiction module component (TIGR02574 family)